MVVPYLNARGPPAHSATLPPMLRLAQAGRIGRIEQADAPRRRPAASPVITPGCDDGEQVAHVDREDAVEALQRQRRRRRAAGPRRRCSRCRRRAARAARRPRRRARAIAATSAVSCRDDDEVGRLPALQRVGAVAQPRRRRRRGRSRRRRSRSAAATNAASTRAATAPASVRQQPSPSGRPRPLRSFFTNADERGRRLPSAARASWRRRCAGSPARRTPRPPSSPRTTPRSACRRTRPTS